MCPPKNPEKPKVEKVDLHLRPVCLASVGTFAYTWIFWERIGESPKWRSFSEFMNVEVI